MSNVALPIITALYNVQCDTLLMTEDDWWFSFFPCYPQRHIAMEAVAGYEDKTQTASFRREKYKELREQ